MINPAILNATGEVLNSKIEFMTTIFHNASKYFMAIGVSEVFILKSEFEKLTAIIEYRFIERLIISTSDPYLF